MAKTTIGILNVRLSAQTAAFSKGMKKAAKQTKKFRSSLKRVSMAVGAFGAAAATAAAYGLSRLTRSQMSAIDSMGKLADAAGTTTESIAAMRLAGQLAGASVDQVDKAVRVFSRRIGEATQGTGEAVKGFEMLGLSADRLAQMDTIDAFSAVADEINKLPTASERAAAGYFTLGRSAMDLMNLIRGGSKAMSGARKQTLAFGTALDRKAVAKVEAANDAMTTLKEVFKGVGSTIAVDVAPFIIAIARRLTEAGASGKNFGARVSEVLQGVINYVGMFADGMQLVGKIVIKVQRLFLGIASLVPKLAEQMWRLLAAIDPTGASEFMHNLTQDINETVQTFKDGAKAADDFLGGKALSLRLRSGLMKIKGEASAIADEMLRAGQNAAGMEMAMAGADMTRKQGEFREVSRARTAFSGGGRDATYWLERIAQYSQQTAQNSRMMGLN